PSLKSQALDAFLAKSDSQKDLVAIIENNAIPASNVDAKHRERLLTSKDPDIRSRAAKLFDGPSNADRQKVLRDYQAVVTMNGDVTRGKAVFAKNCAACHRMEDVGHAVGPDLAQVVNKTPQYPLQEILE